MTPNGYRLQMTTFTRVRRVVMYVVLGLLFVPVLIEPTSTPLIRAGCLLGLALSAFGLRVALGAAVIVKKEGLRVYTWWPRHRDIPWYRVFAVDVVPGHWLLELELNSGDRVRLPVVERVDELYEQIEDLRQRLDV
jgi:hypothetical protein